jgi:subtilisin family serine protease
MLSQKTRLLIAFFLTCIMLLMPFLSLAGTGTQIIVQFKDLSQSQNIEPSKLIQLKKQIRPRDIAVYRFKPQVTKSERISTVQTLRQTSNIKWVTFDAEIALPQQIPNDTYQEELFRWQNPIQLDPLWDETSRCDNVIVAILDSGLDIHHPDLEGNVWTNPSEIADNGIDDDNNGYIDDVHGWNTINQNGNVADYYGHGTHVAGIIGAIGNNAEGVSGSCWQANLLPIKFLSQYGSGSLSNAAAGIYYLLQIHEQYPNTPIILNNSWAAGTTNVALNQALDDALNAGILIINAAGNSGLDLNNSPTYPAMLAADNLAAISVANLSTEISNNQYANQQSELNLTKLHSSSNYGLNIVTLAAPGTDILSSWPLALSAEDYPYQYETGTSMAAPMISGLAALIWQHYPELTASEMRALIENSSYKVDSLIGKLRIPAVVDDLNAFVNATQQQSSLGYIQTTETQTLLRGVNLGHLSSVSLNGQLSLSTQPVDDTSLAIVNPGKLRSGYLSAQTNNGMATQPLYLDWKPSPPQDIAIISSLNNQYTLSWNTQENVDEVEIEVSDSEGNFTHLKTVKNTTQTAEVILDSQNVSFRLRSRSYGQNPDGSEKVALSEYSPTYAMGQLPKWQTLAIAGARINHPFYLPLAVQNASTIQIDLTTPISGKTLCLPTGINFNGDPIHPILSGTPEKVEKCAFTLVAISADQLAARKTYELEVVADTIPAQWTLKISDQNSVTFKTFNSHLSGLRLNQSEVVTNELPWQIDWWYQKSEDSTPLADNINLIFPLDTNLINLKWASSHSDITGTFSTHEAEFSLDLNQKSIESSANESFWRFGVELETQDNHQSPAKASSKDFRCFIASQVFGRYDAKPLDALRWFRNEWLQKSHLGQQFIHFYYRHSPSWVEWGKRHPNMMRFVRPLIKSQLTLLAYELKALQKLNAYISQK